MSQQLPSKQMLTSCPFGTQNGWTSAHLLLWIWQIWMFMSEGFPTMRTKSPCFLQQLIEVIERSITFVLGFCKGFHLEFLMAGRYWANAGMK